MKRSIEMIKILLLLLFSSVLLFEAAAQKPRTQFNGFGHLDHMTDLSNDHSKTSSFLLGEHDFFITSTITDKISFLGEYVIRYNSNSSTNFLPSIERSFIKFNYRGNHNFIAGKIHTPLNYWNDVYHHGRVFFPIIERPIAFSHIIPLHTTGIQLQGQNLGDHNFGYDLVYGNGISARDGVRDRWAPSVTAAFHFKPVKGMRVGASYYFSNVYNNVSGAHVGHTDPRQAAYTGPVYKGDVAFHLVSGSFAYFGNKLEVLNEFNGNLTNTDTLGAARNIANFFYAGYRINEKAVPYIHADYMHISKNDLYTYPYKVSQIAAGFRYEFSPYVNMKLECDYQTFDRYTQITDSKHGHLKFKVQLAYGF